MKIKRYSLYGKPWYEEIKNPDYIIESNNFKFCVEDKDLNITSSTYFLIYKKNNIDKDLIYITIGNYCIAYIEGAYINCKLSTYEEVNKVLSLKDFIFIQTYVTIDNIKDNYILELDRRKFNKKDTYVQYVNNMFYPIKLTDFGIFGIYIGFNNYIDGNSIPIIEKTSVDIKTLAFPRDCSSIKAEKFKDYKVFYEDRIKQILSIK